ncbi:hypothetical protein [Kitasatospora sp. NPDC085879]|uniref:hypothetical protein n=1 Tax=Kitasatospora sp. NPDC085879 TaxID=3154769 RepID=UPI003434EA54
MEMRLDRAQVLVVGQDDFVREVEDADAPVLELQGDSDGEVEVLALVADLQGGEDPRWPTKRVMGKSGRLSSTVVWPYSSMS